MGWWLAGDVAAGGHLEWAAPPWVVLLAVAGAVLAWALALVGRRGLLPAVAEAALWGVALAGLAAAVAGPTWVVEEGHREPGRVVVLVDGSRSMNTLEEGQPRWSAVDGILETLSAPDVEVHHFGDDLYAGAPSGYELPGTDVEGALGALSERVAGERLAGIVLVSDGLDRGLLRKAWARGEGVAPELPGPLTVIQVGHPGQATDLAVRAVDAGGFAFLRSPFRIRAHLEGAGFEGRTVRVRLTRDGAQVTERRVTLDDRGRADVVFEVTPESAGRFAWAVEVPAYEDDAVPGNNSMSVVVRVVRDKMRVLQVAGMPTWDVKFLRRFLKGDPSVDLVSFFILRTNQDMDSGYGDRELALIPFPTRDLFSRELRTFDVVVFHNFDYRPYFDAWRVGTGRELLDNVRAYVEEQGGAFVMIGGDRSFDAGDYRGTPLEGVLPVTLGRGGELVDPAPFRPLLTEDGERHPVTRLMGDRAENEQWWSRLHEVDGSNLVAGPSPGASVLLAHPRHTDPSGNPLPVLAVKEAGLGRSMALTLDGSWRWSFSEAAEGRGNQAYLRFWKNAIRWLVQDPTSSRVTVDTPRENYAVGDEVKVVVRARDTGFAPLAGATARVVVAVGGDEVELRGVTGDDGEVVLEWPAAEAGAHRVRALVSTATADVGTAQTVFAVTTRDPELDEVEPDEAFLRWLAESTGGLYQAPDEVGAPLRDPEAGRTLWERSEVPLGRSPLLILVVLIAAGAAWIVRRRSGLR